MTMGNTLKMRPVPADQDTSGLRPVASVFLFGLAFLCTWTIGVHIATFNALPLAALYPALGLALLAGALASRLDATALFASPSMRLPAISLQLSALSALGPVRLGVMVLLAAAGALAMAVQYKTSNLLPLWAVASITALVALALGPRRQSDSLIVVKECEPGPAPVSPTLAFVLFALLLLGFYFFTSVPDADDSLFLNLATGALRERDALFANDTMLGIPGLSFLKSTYRLESYQLLAAVIADLTGMRVIMAAHAVLPALMLIWTASVFVLLHRALFPAHFPVTMLFHLMFLIAMDGAFQSWGFHAIPRFFQGKGPFVTTLLPLIAFLTVSALREGRWSALALLAAAFVASLGFTANAIYAGPLTAALIGVVFLLGKPQTRLRPFRLVLTILYPVALAAILLLGDPPPAGDMHDNSVAEVVTLAGSGLWGLFGSPYMHALGLALLLAAAGAALAGAALRPVTLYTLVLLLLVMNPFLWDIYNRAVTGGNNTRIYWAVPLPFLLSLGAGLLWQTRSFLLRALLVAGLAGLAVAPGSIFYKTTPGLALLKVPAQDYRFAKTVNALATDADVILAPEEIAAWIPTFEDARPVVEARELYLVQRGGQFARDDLLQRATLFMFWTGEPMLWRADKPLERLDELGALLGRFAVSIVVLDTERPYHMASLETLRALGFAEQAAAGKYRVLKREAGQE